MSDQIAVQPSQPGKFASTRALLAGFVTVLVLSLATDQLFHILGVYPPWGEPMRGTGQNLLALSYRVVYAVLGSYIAARLAPRNPMRHAMILGAIGFVLSTLGADRRPRRRSWPALVSDRAGAHHAALRLARRLHPRGNDGEGPMTNSSSNEAAVRAHLDKWLEASRAMDIDAHHGLLRAGRGFLRLPFGVSVSRSGCASQASGSLLPAYGRAGHDRPAWSFRSRPATTLPSVTPPCAAAARARAARSIGRGCARPSA